MLDKLKAFFEFSSKIGLYLPAAHDVEKDGPSVTLLFAYVSFVLSVGSVIYLVTQNVSAGVTSALILWTLATVFYMIKRINKFKADLDDKSIELDNDESITQEKEKK